ncbi:epoxide hydrolase [Iodidimonas gelatinilytica]|uniref:Epoxide hydrolase n=1 Tax=Iodidimonas gelatinilytica TaxID=1236966 RepID=A0A5A7MP66_9PROT|nr:alpha/beta hydrolase [Iodidimonas gelatinilytica]GEQ97757.1 epoxide hydrolase [Iodidimonas gelatinilytica]
MEDLTARFDVIAPDMIGYGFSAKPKPYGYSLFDQADLVEGLLSDLGVARPHILAHDFGDSVAQELLARLHEPSHALDLASVFMLNGGIFYDRITPVFTQRLLRSPFGRISQHLMTRQSFGWAFTKIFGPDTQPDKSALDDFWHLITYNGGKRVMHDIIQYLGERQKFQDRWTMAFAKSPIPLRFVYGPLDPVSGTAMAERFARIAPATIAPHVIRLDGIGHYPQIEAPKAVLAAFDAFQAGLSSHPMASQ